MTIKHDGDEKRNGSMESPEENQEVEFGQTENFVRRKGGNSLDAPKRVPDNMREVAIPQASDLRRQDEQIPPPEMPIYITRRKGGNSLDAPVRVPHNMRELTPKEIADRQENEDRISERKSELEEELAKLEDAGIWQLPAPIRRFCALTLIVTASILGLFLVTEIVQFSANVSVMSGWSKWVASAFFGIFFVALVCIFVGLIRFSLNLNQTPSIPLKSLKILAQRRELQIEAEKKVEEAKTSLEAYLNDWRHESTEKRMLGVGMKESEWTALEEAVAHLLDETRPDGVEDWLEDFQNLFQHHLDKVADRRISTYMKRVGFGTASSPNPLIDRVIVLAGTMSMVKDLFQIYCLKPGFGQTATILARSVVHTYLADKIQQSAESMTGTLAEMLGDTSGETKNILVNNVGKKIGGKMAEGVVNGVLVRRLGNHVRRTVQPIRQQ